MLNISGQNIDLTPSIKDMIGKKYKKIESRFMANKGEFQFSKTKDTFRCHLEVTTHQFGKFSAESKGDDFYKASAETFNKIERQLNDAKNKSSAKGKERILEHLPSEDDVVQEEYEAEEA
tara:strand:+ start:2469 stop:2828 length:360 start_codon:yes stop_codon:yes gene_type:complete